MGELSKFNCCHPDGALLRDGRVSYLAAERCFGATSAPQRDTTLITHI